MDSTSWTLIQGAAAGSPEDRNEFARRYHPVVRAYLQARWCRSPRLVQRLDDAVQEVFLDCFRGAGALGRARPGGAGGFRAFLYGVCRNVALRFESFRQSQHAAPSLEAVNEAEQVPDDESSLSRVFDRAWARSLLADTLERMASAARVQGDQARLRVDLLRQRFYEGRAPRDIAAASQIDIQVVYRELDRAKNEFRDALRKALEEDRGSGPVTDDDIAELFQLL